MTRQIHETAIIDDNVEIGKGVKIWHWVHVCSNSSLGDNSSLGQNVYVGPNVSIGQNVKIQNNVSVYEGVTLEDDVFCGPSMVFTNVINPRSGVNRKQEFLPTLVRKGASLGANCTIVCGNTVGQYAFVGAGAVINSNVPDFALMVGVPAKQIGWVSEHGERLELPLTGQEAVLCRSTGAKYILSGNTVTKEDTHGID